MKNLTTLFFALFFAGNIFSQDDNSQQIPPMRDGLREQYSQIDFRNFLMKESNGEIPPQGGIVDQQAATDVLVNNSAGATGTAYFTQSEMSILAFGSNVLIGFNDSGSNSGGSNKFTGWSYSTDGGATFTDGGTLPTNSGGDAGDPVLARNETTGRIYLSTLGYSVSTIQMFRSDNNGLTWMAPVNATPGGSSEDKQWHIVDNFAGPGNGNVYLISRRFGGSGGIYMFRSTDNGNTFGPTGGVSIFSGGQGAFVAVGPDHSVYAFYYNGTTSILVRKSTDFGVTFGSPVTIFNGITGGTNGDLDLRGIRQGTSTPEYFRSNSFPHVAVNPVSGHLYATFNNNPAGADKGNIYMVMSTDGGATWTAPVQVNDDVTTTDQWQPTIAVTPDGANIGIFYYSRQEDIVANNLFKYYGRIGTISGSTVTFAPSFAISDVASLPEFGRDLVVNEFYMGDYQHAMATNDAFHVTWADNRADLAGGAPRKDPSVYYEKIILGPPCPVQQATSPNPPSGTVNVPITLPQISWANGAGATSIQVYFNSTSVYTGPPITSWPLSGLTYATTYTWRVDGSDGSCTTYGPTWSFTTVQDPNLFIDTVDVYPQSSAYWTGNTQGSIKTDGEINTVYPKVGWAVFDISSIPSNSTITGVTFYGYINLISYPYWSATPMGNVNPVTDAAATINNQIQANWGSNVAYIYFGGQMNETGWWNSPLGNGAMSDLQNVLAQGWFAIGFIDWDFSSSWYINFDGWSQTNPPYLEINYQYVVPVELISFAAASKGADVELSWTTATETNNQGFQVERMNDGGSFEQVGYVAGSGTTTEPKAYSFIDSKLEAGNYTYRLKQIDFNGSYEYSDEVNVDITLPLEYALEQNFPNPFNPSTTIKYSIAEDGFVKLAVYNMLGEEVALLVNAQQKAGRYEYNFDANGLASGVYVYRVEASNFTSVKKLMLLK